MSSNTVPEAAKAVVRGNTMEVQGRWSFGLFEELWMLDGFNEGWIDFECRGGDPEKGAVRLEAVLKALTERGAKAP